MPDAPDVRIGTLAAYLAETPPLPPDAPTWRGELRSGARANLLMGVTSARIDVKRAAARAERRLERYAEPLFALHVTADDVARAVPAPRLAPGDRELGARLDLRLQQRRGRRPGARPLRRGRADRLRPRAAGGGQRWRPRCRAAPLPSSIPPPPRGPASSRPSCACPTTGRTWRSSCRTAGASRRRSCRARRRSCSRPICAATRWTTSSAGSTAARSSTTPGTPTASTGERSRSRSTTSPIRPSSTSAASGRRSPPPSAPRRPTRGGFGSSQARGAGWRHRSRRRPSAGPRSARSRAVARSPALPCA